jgi:glutaredoxin
MRVSIEVVVYSKPDCHLCDEVKATLERVRQSHPFALSEVNILEDPTSYARLKEEIPVVFVNGRKAFKYRLDETDFIRRLEAITGMERKIIDGA